MSKITIIKMPSLSPTMTTGNVKKWIKGIGDKVVIGDVIAEIETDKAIMEMESMYNGIIQRILIDGGTNDVSVESAIAIISPDNIPSEEIDKFLNEQSKSAKKAVDMHRVGGFKRDIDKKQIINNPKDEKKMSTVNTETILPTIATLRENRVLITPYARYLAGDLNYSNIIGTGKDSFITAMDIEKEMAFIKDSKNSTKDKNNTIQLSQMRKAISSKVCYSKKTIPHFYVTANICIKEVIKNKIEFFQKHQIKTTLNDWFMIACSKALIAVPQMNQVWEIENEILVQSNEININCAIDVGSGPLLVIIKNLEEKGLMDVRGSMIDIVNKAKENKITPQDLETGTFSMSNLGMYGVSHFQAIVNPPQVGVLAIGSAECNDMCAFTLSCDHRALDGRDAALFLQSIRRFIENPVTMLL